jgi:hypothetical protein
MTLPDWAAFYANDYGFTRMTINNETHISIQQISVEQVFSIKEAVLKIFVVDQIQKFELKYLSQTFKLQYL